jgi:hypothetical protein
MMHDQAQRPAALGFIFTDLMLRFNHIIELSATQKVDLSGFVQGAQIECSAWTDNDPHYSVEWLLIQKERHAYGEKDPDYLPGSEGYEDLDLAWRCREMGVFVRSAYRMGVISKIETNRTKWTPSPSPEMIEVEA